jgi:hypothetical protein
MLDFRTVTFHIASYSPIIHQVAVRNAWGGGAERDLTNFKYLILYRVVLGQLLAVYSDICKKNLNMMT